MNKFLFQLLAVLVLVMPALAQTQPGGTPLLPNRVDGFGAPAAAAVPVNRAPDETTIDILGSYYQQDGTHGAVEGGRGTEQLTDVTPTIIVNIPLDTVSRLSVNIGADFYASASTDRIDFALSSPSSRDVRIHADFGYTREQKARGTQWGAGAGFSQEYDYLSFNGVGSFAKTSADGNRQLGLTGQVFIDQATLIRPIELRDGQPSGQGARQSYNVSASFSQVLTKRLQVAVSTELVQQNGLLSTPFHRVYFFDNPDKNPVPAADNHYAPLAPSAPRSEKLPDSRFKYPVGLRLNYYASDLVQIRSYYRFYNDNFGIQAHTFELELPVKVTPFFVLYPFYRFHQQTASKYFAPYLAHSIAEAYYTSDYDLSDFTAHKTGLGLRYSPVYGIGRFHVPGHDRAGRPRVMRFRAVDLRYAHYQRSTDLTADILSFDLGFAL
ncbi:DUF3570 domain-containing protein [Hymenobacter sp. BT683]|uniref:DUF3570 domain-containing protein n=1 Tax=Hymenobacter jeongseonensis TaxID=2791027 RepID=A0ABS0IJ00_9BACT|nr:DUF3570 domain-containing protein [Hymenobacter jeongseonensis]MBF9238350.1 DUF3570 domain-containing protein [Hymenobacter jeongseonensis]